MGPVAVCLVAHFQKFREEVSTDLDEYLGAMDQRSSTARGAAPVPFPRFLLCGCNRTEAFN